MKTIRQAEIRWSRVSLVRDESPDDYKKSVTCSRDVSRVATALLGECVHESLLVFYLDTKNRILGVHEASRGGMAAAACKPGDIYRGALLAVASAIVLAHNHPSGVSTPSEDDITFTRKMRRAGELLGVQLLDHIVVADESYTSFLDSGLLSD